MAIAGSILLLVGAALWTVIIKKVEAVNTMEVLLNGSSVPLGIEVSVGIGLYLLWAAFAVLAVSIVPYMLRCVLCGSYTKIVHSRGHFDHLQLLYLPWLMLRFAIPTYICSYISRHDSPSVFYLSLHRGRRHTKKFSILTYDLLARTLE